jgi:hypothetical protein
MKKLIIALCVTCALVLAAQAQEGKKQHRKMTEEQQTVMKDMLAKYDTNKDGKLDKEERSKMSAADKETWQKAFPSHKKHEKSN